MTTLALCNRALKTAGRKERTIITGITPAEYRHVREAANPPLDPKLKLAWRICRLIDRLMSHYEHRLKKAVV